RCSAVEFVALAHRRFARSNVDSRRTGGHACWSFGRRFNTLRDARIERRPSRCERNLLFGGRRDWSAAFRLRDRSVWPQEIVLYHRRSLSHWHRALWFLLEFLELRIVSRNHWSWHWRRIRCDQFGDR